nr:hypothetical protein Hi04_10k_c3120_00018 [uncultured bacterium]
MRRSRALGSRLAKGASLSFVLASFLAACASGGPAFETVTTLPKPAPHPAGADIDPEPELPAAERHGATESGLLVLETPVDPAAARAVIAAFFRAVVAESPSALAGTLAPNAVMQDGSRRELAAGVWSARFARFDYRSLAGESLYRESAVVMREDRRDLWVEVPLEVAWGSRPRMLGDVFTLRLTPIGSSWAIAEILEEFRSP